MHAEAMEFLQRLTIEGPVIEIGSRIVNGSARDAFPGVEWWGIDSEDGPGVDEVYDAAEYWPHRPVLTVVCCEVLEHSERWRDIIRNVGSWQNSLTLVITCAGPGRPAHSAIDGGPLRDGEYYRNLSAAEIRAACLEAGFRGVFAEQSGYDTRAIAWM